MKEFNPSPLSKKSRETQKQLGQLLNKEAIADANAPEQLFETVSLPQSEAPKQPVETISPPRNEASRLDMVHYKIVHRFKDKSRLSKKMTAALKAELTGQKSGVLVRHASWNSAIWANICNAIKTKKLAFPSAKNNQPNDSSEALVLPKRSV